MINLPTIPVAPGAGATPEDYAAFNAAATVYDLALRTLAAEQAAAAQITREKQAQAQADTAAAMTANVAAQKLMAAAFALPAAEPTVNAEKRAMCIALLSHQPVGINMTETGYVKSVLAQVDAVFAALPKSPTAAGG